VWDAAAQQAYLSSSSGAGPQRCHFVSYEDPQSILAKGAYARAHGLGGAIVWTVNQGHLPAQPAGSRDPLMQAAYEGFLAP
jgi:chitinase